MLFDGVRENLERMLHRLKVTVDFSGGMLVNCAFHGLVVNIRVVDLRFWDKSGHSLVLKYVVLIAG